MTVVVVLVVCVVRTLQLRGRREHPVSSVRNVPRDRRRDGAGPNRQRFPSSPSVVVVFLFLFSNSRQNVLVSALPRLLVSLSHRVVCEAEEMYAWTLRGASVWCVSVGV